MDAQVIELFKKWQDKERKYPDLDIEKVEFEDIPLSDGNIFKFIKGRNVYVRKYNLSHPGEIPLATGSVKNNGIGYYIEPIDESHIIKEESVSFNKDGDTKAFYRNYPYLMDRHHIAIIPKKGIVLPKYLYYTLDQIFKNSNYNWGENTANAEVVAENRISIPIKTSRYTSYEIQQAIVEFLDYRLGLTQATRKQIGPIREKVELMDKIMLPKIFEMKDTYLREQFDKWTKNKQIDLKSDNINFDIIDFDDFFQTISPSIKIKEKEMLNKGKNPVVSQSEGTINGYTNIESGCIDANKQPIIIFGDHTTIVKYIDFRFCVGADGTKILKPKEGILPKYAYFQSVGRISPRGYERHFKYFKKIKFLVPKENNKFSSIDIQNILVEFIETIYAWSSDIKNRINKISENLDLLDETTLALTFRK